MEARIAGINIPVHKHINIALRSIYGIGPYLSLRLCKTVGIDPATKVKDLAEEKLDALREQVGTLLVEGELRRKVSMDIKRKIDISCYQGIRHRRGLPLKQRTRTNARTRKGRRRQVK